MKDAMTETPPPPSALPPPFEVVILGNAPVFLWRLTAEQWARAGVDGRTAFRDLAAKLERAGRA